MMIGSVNASLFAIALILSLLMPFGGYRLAVVSKAPTDEARRVAAAALNRLYGYVRGTQE